MIKVYITSVSANSSLKKNQQTIIDTLTAKGIPFELIDISSSDNEEQKMFMRQNAKPTDGQANPMPPQLFCDEEYLGDYDAFYEATEDNNLDVFFKLVAATQTSEATLNVAQPGITNSEDDVTGNMISDDNQAEIISSEQEVTDEHVANADEDGAGVERKDGSELLLPESNGEIPEE